LADGVHTLTDHAVDSAGNVSALSPSLVVTVDTQPPVSPGFTTGTLGSLAGTGEAGASVTLFAGSTTIGAATVSTLGTWSMSFLQGLAPRTLTAVETDRAGNVSATSSSQVLLGTSGNDTLSASGLKALLIGGSGADVFSFGANFGQDVIADFTPGGITHDVIAFHGNAVLNSFANVMSHTTAVGSGVMISMSGSESIMLNNVSKSALTAADFRFT
jgi:Ca2+-binding RTX toxin-like protein